MRKNIIKLLTIAAVLIISSSVSAQQQFSFTQYMNNPTQFNPAYSTISDNANFNILGRRQLVGITGAPVTYLFNGSVPISSIGGSAGVIVLNDNDPVYKYTEVNAFLAKKVQLSGTNYLSVSLNAGFRNMKADFSQVDPSDPKFQTGDVNETIPNLGFGVMFFGSDYYVGLSVPRFTLKQTQINTNVSDSYYLSAAWLKDLGDDFKIKPACLLAYPGPNLPLSYNLSATFYAKNVVGLGVNYHSDNMVAGILSLFLDNNFKIGYSYQVATGKYALGGSINTTQELSLGYSFGKGGIKLL